MGYPLRFKRKALEQLDALYGYIVERDTSAGKRMLAKVHEVFKYLKTFPRLGRITDERHVRCFVVGNTGLLIFYTFEHDVVIIIRILHERQNRT